MKIYPKNLLPWELEPHFYKHMLAMTAENLNNKAEIAQQLAYRDKQIEQLRSRVKDLEWETLIDR